MSSAGSNQTAREQVLGNPTLDTSRRELQSLAEPSSAGAVGRKHRDQTALKDQWTKFYGPPDKAPVLYKDTWVLLLYWDFEGNDADFDVTNEVSALREVFEKGYRFKVVTRKITTKRGNPTLEAKSHVVNFAYEADAENRMLIVYYAGHGGASKVDPDHGNITLFGTVGDQCREEMGIEWGRVESILTDTKSDILEVFDCCHAGLLCKPYYRSLSRNFQILAACGPEQQTPVCSKESFTTAMTWALKELLKTEKGFYTSRLLAEIQKAPHFPKCQNPQIYPGRFREIPGEHLYIAPYRDGVQQGPDSKAVYRDQRDKEVLEQEMLDLRFHFAKKISDDDLQHMAYAMKRVFPRQNELLSVSAIGKYGHEDEILLRGSSKDVKELAAFYVERWRKYTRENISAGANDRSPAIVSGPGSSKLFEGTPSVAHLASSEEGRYKKGPDVKAVDLVLSMFVFWIVMLLLPVAASIAGFYLLKPEHQEVVMNFIWLNVTGLGGGGDAEVVKVPASILYEQMHQ